MVYRNNTGRLGCWLHQCVLRNTLAGSKTVVSTSRDDPVRLVYIWHDSFMCVVWRIHLTLNSYWKFAQVLLKCKYEADFQPQSDVWHDSFICVVWRIHVYEVAHSYVWHGTLLSHAWYAYGAWRIHRVDHESFIRVTSSFVYVIWFTHTSHGSFVWDIWIVHMWHDSFT